MKLVNKNSLIMHILFTYNNILCTLTNLEGQPLSWVNAGSKKVKGVKKITNTTIFNVIKSLYNQSKIYKLDKVYVRIKGNGKQKNILVKYLKVIGFDVLLIQENLCIPFSGCKRPKVRKL